MYSSKIERKKDGQEMGRREDDTKHYCLSIPPFSSHSKKKGKDSNVTKIIHLVLFHQKKVQINTKYFNKKLAIRRRLKEKST